MPAAGPQDQCFADVSAHGAAGPWRALEDVLDRYATAGREATFWWRDDDAGRSDPALDRLLDLAGDSRPLCVAAIPMRLESDAAARLGAAGAGVRVLPHGYAHRDHAAPGAKKIEAGGDRPVGDVLAEIAAGLDRLDALVGARLVPIFVPPWNRIAPAVADALTADGAWAGLSVYKARAPGERGARLNAHIDIVDWKGGRGFVGAAAALDLAMRHLEARLDRTADIDPEEPTGLLTHHLDHDEACWRFAADFLAAIDAHPAARLVGPEEGLQA
jgi:peptidoglycan/xylan/chitin deacetylase (PgdA/CDA1 family)